MHRLKLFTYGQLILTTIVAMLLREYWLARHRDEMQDGEKRLPLEFSFTQVDVLTRWTLLWPFLVMAIVFFYLQVKCWGRGLARLFIRRVMAKWCIASVAFSLYYYSFMYLTDKGEEDFDPSGHVAVHLVGQAAHSSTLLFVVGTVWRNTDNPITNNDDDDKFQKQGAERRSSPIATSLLFIVYLFFQTYACVNVFFAAYIYHTTVESLVGLFVGLTISLSTYESDYSCRLCARA